MGLNLKKEEKRLRFIEMTQGVDKALEFARVTMKSYRCAVLHQGHYAGTPRYRKDFIESYLDFKKYLRYHKT